VTESRPPVYPELTRPGTDGAAGRLDEALYDLVEARFERLLRDNPILATSMGIHEHDDELGDAGVDALLSEVEADKAFGLTLDNKDSAPHNVAIYTDSGAGTSISVGEVVSATTTTQQVPALTAGSYFFRCDVHHEMTGTINAS